MSFPLANVKAYLGDDTSFTDDEIESALLAESAAQAYRCRVPLEGQEWSADLAEALCRRVAVNLANRSLPLGVSVAMAETNVATTRVGGRDAEVARLEAPHRRLVIG